MRFSILLLLIAFSFSCQPSAENTSVKAPAAPATDAANEAQNGPSNQKLDPMESDASKSGLLGKVKEIKIWKKAFHPKGKELPEKITLEESFNEKGSLLSRKEYDHVGKLKKSESFVYDLQNKKISSSSLIESYSRREKFTRTDTGALIKNLSGNELISTSYLQLDEYDRITKMSGFGEKDTLINQYFYDENHRLVKEIRYNNKTGKTRTVVNDYQYNSDGLLSEETLDYGSDRAKVHVYQYEELKLVKKKLLFGGKMRSTTEYDEFGNETLVQYYKRREVRKTERYTYKYDSSNNWISYQKDIKNHSSETANFQPNQVVRRSVTYHE